MMANERAQELLGLSEQEFIEEPEDIEEWHVFDPSGKPLEPPEMPSACVLRTGEPVLDEELVIESPSGRQLHVNVNAAPLFGADGTIERMIMAGEDITELKEHERQLKKRKAELETELSEILGRISNAFYALDEEWRFTHLNERAAAVMGRPKDELLNRNIWELFPEAEDSIYWEQLHTAMETQESVSFELYAEKRGEWLEFSVYPSESGLSIYFHDITERIERERKLEESEQRYRTLVNHFPNGAVALVDRNLEYRTLGGRPLEAVNASIEELSGAPVREILPPEIADELVPRYEAALDGESDTLEMDLGGQTYQFQFVPVRDDNGDVFAALGMSQDITERREYERKLEESNERLEQFAYAASHDLQEPLRMVSSYLQLIEHRYRDLLDEDGEEFLEFAINGADRMRSMIEGLLHYSRVETQGNEFEPIELEAVLEDVREILQVKLEEHDAEIRGESLPCVEGDESQLRQVFQNLLSNAIEYSGDEPPRVNVSAERDGSKWIVSVADEGIGISAGDQERIFEIFQRAHGERKHAGTGIGLALCERIVERHSGDIWVESTPGEGATFSFSLPAVTARSDECASK
nr:PAS domain-containing protein [Haloprofundus salilacus]